MSGINVFALLLFVPLNLLAARVSRWETWSRERTLRLASAVLLLVKTTEYLLCALRGAPKLPVEFSSLSYFVCPLILLLSLRPLSSFGTYAGFMAGIGYYLAVILAGDRVYAASPAGEILLSALAHGTLYFCAMVRLRTRLYPQTELPRLLNGVGLCLLWAILLRPAAGWGDTPLLIYTLLDALPVRGLTPDSLQSTAVPAYYVVMALLLCTSASGFFRFNRCMYRRSRSAAGACQPAPLPVRKTV